MEKVSTDVHPYLFFCADDLEAIRKRTQDQPALTFRRALRKLSLRLLPQRLGGKEGTFIYNDRGQARYMAMSAMEGVLGEDSDRIAAAKKALLLLSNWGDLGPRPNMSHGGVLRNAAITYDLLHGELTDGEREQAESFIARCASFLHQGAQSREGWATRGTREANWRATIFAGMGMGGLVLWGRHPDARAWVADASEVVKDILDYELDADGGVYEAYIRYSLNVTFHSILPMMEALRRVTGEDLFGRNDRVLYRMTAFTAYMLYPTLDEMPAFGDCDAHPFTIGLTLAKTAAEYDDGLAGWYLDKLIERGWTPGGESATCGVLWARAVEPEDPDTSRRLSEAFAYNNDEGTRKVDKRTDHGTGHLFLRTGFTHTDDIYLAAQAGDIQGWHSHADQGSYVLAAYGVKFLRDLYAGGYAGEQFVYRKSGEAHQTVLIDGFGQVAQYHGLGDEDYMIKVAGVEAIESRAGYDYVRMNLLTAYRMNPETPPVRSAFRHIVFVRLPAREGYFAVIDDVETEGGEHVYSHPFHYDPMVEVASAEGGRFVLTNPKASLHVSAVASCPLQATRHIQYHDSYVKLTGTEKAGRFVMATVLYPVRGADAPAIEPIDEGETIGAEVGGVRIAYDKSAREVSVSGDLSSITARTNRDPARD